MNESNCSHPPDAILSENTGDVCTLCGRVLDTAVYVNGYVNGYHHESSTTDVTTPTSTTTDCPKTLDKLIRGAAIIHRICASLSIPESIEQKARSIHSDALEALAGKMRGELFAASCASCIYYACKLSRGCGRAEIELCGEGVSLKLIERTNKMLRRALADKPYTRTLLEPLDPAELVPRFLHILKVPLTCRRDVECLIHAKLKSVPDKRPECVVAAAIAIVGGLDPETVRKSLPIPMYHLNACLVILRENVKHK
jgi:transcription initiation factor TFIIIB Brf1 subunit/transcription initiation factor TFIIB